MNSHNSFIFSASVDPAGNYLQTQSTPGAPQTSNIILSEDFYDVLNGVNLPNEATATVIQNEILQQSQLDEKVEFKRPPEPKIEKPIGKGPFTCETCPELKPFTTRGKYKKHLRSHENDKKHKCPKCSVSYNIEKNLR